MDNILDAFTADGFSMTELTEAINVVPNQYGRMRELGIFKDHGVHTTSVNIEYKNGVLNLLPTRKRGAPGSVSKRNMRDLRAFNIPHIPHDGAIEADDVQNVRQFGSGGQLAAIEELVNDELVDMAAKHDITLEHLRMGAIKGQVLDADGSTIYNFFTEFGVSEKVIDFDISGAGKMRLKSFDVARHMEDNLAGEMKTGVHCLTSEEFFDEFVEHADVVRAWDNHQGNSDKLSQDPRSGFFFAGITYEEYRGSATELNEDNTVTTRRFIPAGDARFFPVGTQQLFRTYYAPANYMETVNTKGLPRYAKVIPRRNNTGVDIETQSNPLPLCTRPLLLVRGTA